VIDDFSVHILRYLAGEAHSNSDNLLSVETRQVTQNRVGTETMSVLLKARFVDKLTSGCSKYPLE
jgi:hypothetical protein